MMSYLFVAAAAYLAGCKWPSAWEKIPGVKVVSDKIKSWLAGSVPPV